jgi:hypothetical protein
MIVLDDVQHLEQLRRLFKVKKNEVKMMQYRGMVLSKTKSITADLNLQPTDPTVLLDMKFEQFLAYRKKNNSFKGREEFSAVYYDKQGKAVVVVYLYSTEGAKVNSQAFNQQVRKMIFGKTEYLHFILISENGVASPSISSLEERSSLKYELYLDEQLAINPMEHCFSPLKVEYIKPADVKQFIKDEQLKNPSHMALARSDEIICKYVGAESHGILKLTVISNIYPVNIFYRYVV